MIFNGNKSRPEKKAGNARLSPEWAVGTAVKSLRQIRKEDVNSVNE
jgi:hypothetical protein